MKILIANLLWRIARISPEFGNRVMDFVGYEKYCRIAQIQTITKRSS